ncbi:MAG: HIT domain-containing protein [Candidatus Omnitrophota bacterium]|nr:HIT domain-containing protein [Candidatus Omnitrophota bacterium]
MNKLWAPWRIGYVGRVAKQKGCILCRLRKQNRASRNNFVVMRSKHCYVALNAFPYNNGHVMVVTNRHVATLEHLSDQELLDVNKTLVRTVSVLRKILRAQGFNIGINMGKVAGAGLDRHLHVHCVPRWLGDTNFMPSIARTKVISQSLEELYRKFKNAL